jgi:nucleotide-binding universal stress UspA family protein
MKIEDILVPLDFSAGSLQALEYALKLIDADGEVYLLHVIDSDFLARLGEEGIAEVDAATENLRKRAEDRLQAIVQEHAASGIRIESMVVIGKPFAEILRVAADLDFSLIVMSIRGREQGGIEEILFGSTADKVLRAARIPVICIPPSRLQPIAISSSGSSVDAENTD